MQRGKRGQTSRLELTLAGKVTLTFLAIAFCVAFLYGSNPVLFVVCCIAATVLLLPNIPLLFMGEEYGETAPFQYFIDHGDPDLVDAVRKGRKREFAHFGWREEDLPDPYDAATFERSRVHPGPQKTSGHRTMLQWTRALIGLRTSIPALGAVGSNKLGYAVRAFEHERVLVVHRWGDSGPAALIVLGFNAGPTSATLREPVGTWALRLAATSHELAESRPYAIPQLLNITPEGTTLDLSAYAALVYLNPAQS